MIIKEYMEYREKELLRLYSAVGWTAYTADTNALEQGFRNSMLILGAYENEELIGLVRVVGDGSTIVFVQDLLVLPEKQRQGVGTALMKAVLERYSGVRQIELATDNTHKTTAFYKSLGFSGYAETGICGFIRPNRRRP